MNRHYQSIINAFESFVKWVGYIGALILAITYISQFYSWGNKGLFVFLRNNFQNIWLIVITVVLLGLLIWATRFNRRFVTRFTDNFNKDLSLNWDYEGPWRKAEENTLLVTGSDSGGITKIGSTWENYTLTCDARITNECLGIIVRAQDLNNYYMFQIYEDKIKPHRRIAVPLIEETRPKAQNTVAEDDDALPPKGETVAEDDDASPPKEETVAEDDDASPPKEETARFKFVKYGIVWQILESPTPINPHLTEWFKVAVVVHGESIQLYINNELFFQRDAFLKIPMGKVGFRNHGAETALVRNVRVIVRS